MDPESPVPGSSSNHRVYLQVPGQRLCCRRMPVNGAPESAWSVRRAIRKQGRKEKQGWMSYYVNLHTVKAHFLHPPAPFKEDHYSELQSIKGDENTGQEESQEKEFREEKSDQEQGCYRVARNCISSLQTAWLL
ncbi:hypothetical protein CapIbe_008324 [Capra ibex]